jgi:protein phosphatase
LGPQDGGALEVEICLQTDPGLVRANNEDRGVYKTPSNPEVAAQKGTLVMVADGMGGASAGEVASELAIRLVPEFYYSSTQPPALALKEALERASSEIHRTAQSDPELRGMGTTCVAVAILPPEVYMAYVGDSRLYLLRDQSFYQLSEDHSVVFEMVRKGILTRDQAKSHEERNVLSMSMGGRPEIQASFWEKPMVSHEGDRLLICSDGLHDLVSDTEMQAIIADAPVDRAVHNLIATANLRGGLDNITAALIHFRAAREPQTESRATREVMISTT